MLTNTQIKKLRALSHHEKAIVFIGKHGLSETIYESFENALLKHNLVKVNIQKNANITPLEVADRFKVLFSCEVISMVGRSIVFYRYHKKGRIIV